MVLSRARTRIHRRLAKDQPSASLGSTASEYLIACACLRRTFVALAYAHSPCGKTSTRAVSLWIEVPEELEEMLMWAVTSWHKLV